MVILRSKLLGPYRVVKVVGKGSFGVAVLATDVFNRYFVIKEIDIREMDDKEQMETKNEIDMLSKLAVHPFIVRYKSTFIFKSSLCIVMDYCARGDLHSYIVKRTEQGKIFSECEIRRILAQLLLALKHLHDHNVIHRDLKSPNVFIDYDGRIRLGDFGLSKTLDNSVKYAQTYCGTPAFMAPEIIKLSRYSFSADIWALGCIMYEIMLLRLPFCGMQDHDIRRNIVRRMPPQLPSFYSIQLRQLCISMLHKEPTARPTAGDLISSPYMQKELKAMAAEITTYSMLYANADC